PAADAQLAHGLHFHVDCGRGPACRVLLEKPSVAVGRIFPTALRWNVPGSAWALSRQRAYRMAMGCSEEPVGASFSLDSRKYSCYRTVRTRSVVHADSRRGHRRISRPCST